MIQNCIIENTQCRLHCDSNGISLETNFSDISTELKSFKWNVEKYGDSFLDIDNISKLILIMPSLNEIIGTNFELKEEIIPSKHIHTDTNSVLKEITLYIDKCKYMSQRICYTKDENMPLDNYHQSREREFVAKVNSIIYYICWNMNHTN